MKICEEPCGKGAIKDLLDQLEKQRDDLRSLRADLHQVKLDRDMLQATNNQYLNRIRVLEDRMKDDMK